MRQATFHIETWPLKAPFSITGHTFTEMRVLIVTLQENGQTGRGESAGVYYLNETADSILAQAQTLAAELEQGLTRADLQHRLPLGGARNAIDCALWDLDCKLSGQSIWSLTDIKPAATHSVYTVGIDTPEAMAANAKTQDSPQLKVKLDGEHPLACLQAVCAARPDAKIVVDANQAWDFQQLKTLVPAFQALDILMIEQPLKRGEDAELEHYQSPIPLCADESCLDRSELAQAAQRYAMVNIKLDKTGGLTEALALARAAKEKGLGLMVGNMGGTSLAMAPAYVVAQYCQFVDIDGPVLLAKDRSQAMDYQGGEVSAPQGDLWGV